MIAVAIPVIETLTGELAFEGLLDLLLIKSLREAEERVRRSQSELDDARGVITATQNRYTRQTLQELYDAGVTNLQQYLDADADADAGAGRPAQPGPPPLEPGAQGPAPTPPRTGPVLPPDPPPYRPGPRPIDLDGFAPAGPEWDASAV